MHLPMCNYFCKGISLLTNGVEATHMGIVGRMIPDGKRPTDGYKCCGLCRKRRRTTWTWMRMKAKTEGWCRGPWS